MFLWGIVAGLFLASLLSLLFKYLDYQGSEQMSHEYCKRKDGNIGCIDCVAYGADEEQSRIIKLLEELKGDQEGCCDECKPHLESSRNYLTAVISLIKGENK